MIPAKFGFRPIMHLLKLGARRTVTEIGFEYLRDALPQFVTSQSRGMLRLKLR